ncbi:MAG TPA: hypothetical protein VKP68_14395 [Ramlibacter sp.]|nr:hypothetical protein [Ramlibacter sp.]
MSSRNARTDTGEPQEQQKQQGGARSGVGSGSALAAMLKKRREGENHPDEEAQRRADKARGTA